MRLKASSDRAKTHIEKALLGAKAAGIDTELIKEEEIVKEYAEVDADHDKPKLELETVYVCDPFEGEHFELLKKRKIRIVGPQCILSCLNTMKPLPKVSDPIHNLTMLDVVACCTNVPKSERQKLQTHITMMGGKFVGDFTSAVTHLIAGEVGSKKYQVASNLGKIIVLPSWVYACWEQGAYEHKSAFDKEFSRYFCPCFKGFTICVTGLLAEERQQIKTLTTENGGTYSGELNMRTCTHLLVKYPRGEKYEYAKQWKIHCISTRWFYDCIRAGYWLQESPYKLEPGDNPRSSELNMSRSRVDMTAQSDLDISVASLKAAQVAAKVKKGREVQQNTKASIETKPDNKIKNIEEPTLKIRSVKENFTLDKISFRNSALFLDGCKIFLCGSSTKSNDILRRLINSGGGMRFNQMSDDITHVVIVDSITREVERFLQKSEHLPHIVSVHWLVDSFKAGICLREEGKFLHFVISHI